MSNTVSVWQATHTTPSVRLVKAAGDALSSALELAKLARAQLVTETRGLAGAGRGQLAIDVVLEEPELEGDRDRDPQEPREDEPSQDGQRPRAPGLGHQQPIEERHHQPPPQPHGDRRGRCADEVARRARPRGGRRRGRDHDGQAEHHEVGAFVGTVSLDDPRVRARDPHQPVC